MKTRNSTFSIDGQTDGKTGTSGIAGATTLPITDSLIAAKESEAASKAAKSNTSWKRGILKGNAANQKGKQTQPSAQSK